MAIPANPDLVELVQSVPVPFALCDASAVIQFRTAGWLKRFVPGTERVLVNGGNSAPRLVALQSGGETVELPLRTHRLDNGFWLELAPPADAKVEELSQRITELEHHALCDPLTGLWNRRYFDATVPGEIARSERRGHPISLIVVDVDHFKGINDTWGHAVGDQALQAVGQIISQRCRSSDLVMRWGGDEFAVLASFCSWRNATGLAEDLRKRVASAELAPGVRTTLSIGVAQHLPGQSPTAWFDRTDAQLYLAKQEGRNCVAVDRSSAAEVDQAVVQLLWRESYLCGHPTIDDQHQILVSLANRVLQAALPGGHGGPDRQRLLLDLDELLHHIEHHFTDEEAILKAVGYPRARQHAIAHAHLVSTATALRAEIAQNGGDVGKLVDFLARDVVVKHMATADADFFPWLRPSEPA